MRSNVRNGPLTFWTSLYPFVSVSLLYISIVPHISSSPLPVKLISFVRHLVIPPLPFAQCHASRVPPAKVPSDDLILLTWLYFLSVTAYSFQSSSGSHYRTLSGSLENPLLHQMPQCSFYIFFTQIIYSLERQTKRQTDRQIKRQTDRQIKRQTETYRQTQTDRQTDRQRDGDRELAQYTATFIVQQNSRMFTKILVIN